MGGNTKVLDVNTGLFHRDFVTQRSCMGLYPRYEALVEKGGHFYAAVDETGIVGAILSTMSTESGTRADFYCCDGFEKVLSKLLDACKDVVYLQIAECDTKKQELAKKLGFSPASDTQLLQCGDVYLPFRFYQK
jgi:hypothetical protein